MFLFQIVSNSKERIPKDTRKKKKKKIKKIEAWVLNKKLIYLCLSLKTFASSAFLSIYECMTSSIELRS